MNFFDIDWPALGKAFGIVGGILAAVVLYIFLVIVAGWMFLIWSIGLFVFGWIVYAVYCRLASW